MPRYGRFFEGVPPSRVRIGEILDQSAARPERIVEHPVDPGGRETSGMLIELGRRSRLRALVGPAAREKAGSAGRGHRLDAWLSTSLLIFRLAELAFSDEGPTRHFTLRKKSDQRSPIY